MNIKAKKYYGQNFISSKSLINNIVDLLGDKDDDQLIIEIGPGRGALTEIISNRFKNFVVIEIDTELEEILNNINTSNKFEIIFDDILNVDLKEIIKKHNCKKVKIISNTPYYITSKILFKMFELSDLIDKAIFMVQKEVALRMTSKTRDEFYNNLSIACQFYSDVKYEFSVNKKFFKPVPKVDSAIVSLKFNNNYKNKVNNDEKFIGFVRKLFNNKRKTILNNLNNIVFDKNKAKEILDSLNINNSKRPEEININDYIMMYNFIYKI